MFAGFVQLEDTVVGSLLVVDTSDTPIESDALPTFRVYGPDGFIESGTCGYRDTDSVIDATNASPIVITSTSHGLSTGTRVTISGVLGNTATNGTFVITKINDNTFSLDGSTGNGGYTSGGTWRVTGLYSYSISVLASDGYDVGEVFQVLFTYAISAVEKGQIHSFVVE